MDDDPALLDQATSTMSLLMIGGAALGLGALVLRRYRRKAKPEPAATNVWDLEGGVPLEPRLHRRVHQSPVETYAAPPRSPPVPPAAAWPGADPGRVRTRASGHGVGRKVAPWRLLWGSPTAWYGVLERRFC